MIDVCLLGTGGMMPLPYRYLTALMVRYNGKGIMIDCGEGTQVALRKKGWSPKPIDMMLFTHYHADHISGLPGMLLAAAEKYNIDLAESWMIGDSGRDVQAGRAAGCRTALIGEGEYGQDATCASLLEFAHSLT